MALLFLVSASCTRQPGSPPPEPQPAAARSPTLMTPEDLAKLTSQPPDRRITYGTEASQYADLRLPAGAGPHPLVILIHGGCFKAEYATNEYFGAMADALEADGIATWNIEYRRLGQSGSGWPGTYLDIAHAVDHVRTLAPDHHLDLDRVAVVGHSAGGHLAMWTAARHRLPTSSDVYAANPLRIRGVVDLAGPVDMSADIAHYEASCGDTVITSLLGGTPIAVPRRYTEASAITLLPLGLPQVLVVGSHEEFVRLPFIDAYVEAATRAGDPVKRVLIEGAGHFEIASPLASTWPQVKAAIVALVDGKLP